MPRRMDAAINAFDNKTGWRCTRTCKISHIIALAFGNEGLEFTNWGLAGCKE